MNELEREMLMAPPFDVEPIINGNVTVLDKDMQDKIMRHVRGSVRLASRKIVIPDVLLLYNPGVRWLCVTTVVVSEPLDHVRIAAWQTVHSDLLNELSRYCVEQARNALSIGAEDAAKSWLAAKGKLTGISAFCIQGESTDGNMQARNEMLYGQALSVAEEAVSLQGQALDLAVLKNMDVDSCLLAARESWLRNNGCSEESPLVRKYLAWGAESSAKIPSWCLKVKDGFVNKDLIRVNLGVVAASYDDLFEQLNRNVKEYFAKSETQMRDLVDEYMCGYMYEGKDPVSALVDKLESLVAMLNDRGTLPPESWPRLFACHGIRFSILIGVGSIRMKDLMSRAISIHCQMVRVKRFIARLWSQSGGR